MPNPFAPDGTPPPQLDYEALRLIGRGGYGEVWLVRDRAGRYLACKVIYRETFADDRPYEREYEGIKKFEPVSLASESQINILHIGRRDEAGYFYYIMELADDMVTGPAIDPATYIPRTLARELNRRERLPAGECVRFGLSLSAALENLHEHGLIHRDVKPENIIFVNGIPKLADIGLVTDRDVTVSYVGTEGYVPPEGPGSAQADVFALGKVLYCLSTGLNQLDYPEFPSQLGEGAEREAFLELNAAIVKACDRDPRRRYRTAGELHADLTLLSSGKSLRQRHKEEKLRRSALRIIVTLAVMALVVASIAGWLRLRPSPAVPLTSLGGGTAHPETPEASLPLAEVYLRAGFEAWGRDDYPQAKELCSNAMAAAETALKPRLLDSAEFLRTEIARCETEYRAVKPFADRLKEKPADPEANLAVGKFFCFMKNDWPGGLPLLAHGSDDGVHAAAETELAGGEDTTIGDAWWHLAESGSPDAAACRQRAATWYRKAIAKAKYPRKNELSQTLADRIKTPVSPSAFIHIIARVADSQHIDIYADEVVWQNFGVSRGDKINQVLLPDFEGKGTHVIKNTGATRLYPENLDFSTARLIIDRKPKKRGKATLQIHEDHVRLNLVDKPVGSSEIDVTLVFGASTNRDSSPPDQ